MSDGGDVSPVVSGGHRGSVAQQVPPTISNFRNHPPSLNRSMSGKQEFTHQESHQFWKRVVREEKLGLMKSIAKAREHVMESPMAEDDVEQAGTHRLSKNKRTERLRGSIVYQVIPQSITIQSPGRTKADHGFKSIEKFRKAHD